MLVNVVVAVLIIVGLFAIFQINPVTGALNLLRQSTFKMPQRKATAADFVRRINGRKKSNLVKRSLHETHNSLVIIGQEHRFKRIVRLSLASGIAGGLLCLLIFKSILLVIVIGFGCGLIPLWLTNLTVYSHVRLINDQLESALSMITISYIRNNDIVKSVNETLTHMGAPLKDIVQKFLYRITYIDGDMESAIQDMKDSLDNVLFHQWCDILILCQNDHTLKAGLLPIVNKISDLKMQQDENETQMMIPLREIIMMVLLVIAFLPLLYVMNADWFHYLAHTIPGQMSIGATAIIIFASIHKAIKLSKPIDYRL